MNGTFIFQAQKVNINLSYWIESFFCKIGLLNKYFFVTIIARVISQPVEGAVFIQQHIFQP